MKRTQIDKDMHSQIFTKLMYDWGIHDFSILMQTYETIGQKIMSRIDRIRKFFLSGCGAVLVIIFGILPTDLLSLTLFSTIMLGVILIGITMFMTSEIARRDIFNRSNFIDDQIQSTVDRLEYCRDSILLEMPPYNDCSDGKARNHQVGANLITATLVYHVLEKIRKHDKKYNKHDEFKRIIAIANENIKMHKDILQWHAAFTPTDDYPTDVLVKVYVVVAYMKSKQLQG